jgi:two-component system phosphate regulon sensor histidine kinase PhoR
MGSIERQAFFFPPALVGIALAVLNIWVGSTTHEFPATLFSISLLLFILAVAFSAWNARRLVRPLIDLVPQADEVAKGKLVVSNHGSHDVPAEVQSLARAIDRISENQARDLAAMQKLERVRSEFLANVSHELRTPIFAVQGFIETLLDGAIDDPEVNRDFLERARLQAARLNALLSDVIDISRIESGEMRMSFRLFDIVAFLSELVREMQVLAEFKKIKLHFTNKIEGGRSIEAFGDKERLKQVMINLIDNAIKYTNTGGNVEVELTLQAADSLRVTVTDTGIGIDAEHLPRLFERFYRVDKDRARNSPGGTGLGLAIVKHITEAHRGKLSVESEPGKGSSFSFTVHEEPFGVM